MNNTGTLTVTTPTEREIVMTRVLDAPRRLVFEAWTRPELLRRWFGPRGVYREIVAPERLVTTEANDDCDAAAGTQSLVTTTLVEHDGRTTLTNTDWYRTRADAFERKVAVVKPDQWSNQSPCEDWTARDVVSHVIDMHAAMLPPLDRRLPRPRSTHPAAG